MTKRKLIPPEQVGRVPLSEIEAAVEAAAKALHVVKHPRGGWAVWRSGAQRVRRRFRTRGEAIAYARGLRPAVLYIHRADGMVERKEEVWD